MSKTMKTYTGRYFNPADPVKENISIVDIAHGLSMTARFSGQLNDFYSVASHSVLVAEILIERHRKDLALAGLLHDAHEAYMSDIPTPVKDLLQPAVSEIEKRADKAIYAKFGLKALTEQEKKLVKEADQLAYLIETRDLRGSDEYKNEHNYTLQGIMQLLKASPCDPKDAKIQFIEKFIELMEAQKL